MKNQFLSLLIIICSIAVVQNVNAQTIKAKKICGISTCCGFDVTISKGNTGSATISVDERIQPYLNAEVNNKGILVIYFKDMPDKLSRNSYKKTATVTLTSLEVIDMSSASIVRGVDSFTTEDLKIDLSSGSTIKELQVTAKSIDIDLSSAASANNFQAAAQNIDIDLSSGASANISGSTNKLTISTSSAAIANLQNLQAVDVTAKSSSGSEIKCWQTNLLTASAASGSTIRYRGKEASSVTSSGGSVSKLK